jgi:hypothetical protein
MRQSPHPKACNDGNPFMHRGCVVSMSANKKEDNGESPHIEVATSIEEVATARVLLRKPTSRGDGEGTMTIERALNHCTRGAPVRRIAGMYCQPFLP